MKNLENKNRTKPEDLRKFKNDIMAYYKANKRDQLPWRKTTDPYHIFISEMMLQQTQVSRVIPKYTEFLKRFPTIKSLAIASKSDVLVLWQGLGYNRRALFLKKTCEMLYTQNPHRPQFPITKEDLIKLPGIGQSTAGAILAFAYNTPQSFIETNIRAVFLYFFFKSTSSVSDIHILELIDTAIDLTNPREWYYALYDYGSMLKTKLGKNKTQLHKQSKHYISQSAFKGSNREIRSAILKLCIEYKDSKGGISMDKIKKNITEKLAHAHEEKIVENVHTLAKEGFIKAITKKGSRGQFYSISVV